MNFESLNVHVRRTCVVRNKQLFEIVFENLFETGVRSTHSKVAVFEHMFEIYFEQGFEHILECSVELICTRD